MLFAALLNMQQCTVNAFHASVSVAMVMDYTLLTVTVVDPSLSVHEQTVIVTIVCGFSKQLYSELPGLSTCSHESGR